jgi:hypothetical protein
VKRRGRAHFLLRKKPGFPLQSFLSRCDKKGFPLQSLAPHGLSVNLNLLTVGCMGCQPLARPGVKQTVEAVSGAFFQITAGYAPRITQKWVSP